MHVTPVQATVPTGGPPVPAEDCGRKDQGAARGDSGHVARDHRRRGVAAPAGAEDKPSQTPHVAVAITAMDVANHFFVFIDPHSPPNAPTQPRPGQGKEVDVQVNSADVPEGSPVANVQTLRLAAAAGKSSGHRPSVSASVERAGSRQSRRFPRSLTNEGPPSTSTRGGGLTASGIVSPAAAPILHRALRTPGGAPRCPTRARRVTAGRQGPRS